MSVIKVLRDLNGLFNYSTDENPTSQQDYQKAVKNWVKTIVSLVDSNLWQPETEYTVGSQLLTPSLPYYVLRCTVAGTSGAAEPNYTDVALDDEITDGTVTWVVEKLATTAFVNAKAGNYLPLSGGTMTGSIQYVNKGKVFKIGNSDVGNVDFAWNFAKKEGAGLGLRSTDYSSPGEFTLFARDANNTWSLTGKPDGSLTWNSQPLLPVGVVQAFAGSTIPTGWLLCDGSAVSRTTYAKLFSVIGTTYGAGNGSTTFNLPNLTDKFIQGNGTVGTVKSAGLPNITGSMFSFLAGGANENEGALYQTEQQTVTTTGNSSGSAYNWRRINLDASRSNSIYGNSSTVQPPALTMRYIIKY